MGQKSQQLSLTSLDVAIRELETAILLFFHFGDFIAIHVLAFSAASILIKLSKENNLPGGFQEEMNRMIKKDKIKYVKTKVREAYNFFKHGSNSTKVQKFNPKSTEFVILDCCEMYRKLTSERRPLLKLFNTWFFSSHPEMLMMKEDKSVYNDFKTIIKPEERTLFFSKLLPVINKISIGL